MWHRVSAKGTRCAVTSISRRFSASTGSHEVGFIGLGNMGLRMAMNLTKDKVRVLAYDIHPPRGFLSSTTDGEYIQLVSTVSEIGASKDCQTIFTMLPGCEAVNKVMAELIESSSENPTSRAVVDCSTVSPTTSRVWHSRWAEQGNAMIDAPVSGGVKGAEEGTLTFMVGCEQEWALAQARPYLDRMGKRIISCGGPGSGAVTKLCNNLALASQMVGICEAMNMGEALGVDPVVLADVMNTSTAKCWSCDVNNPHPEVALAKAAHGSKCPPAANNYDGGFAAKLMLKDLSLAVACAEGQGVAIPLTAAVKELYKMARLRGLGEKDFGVMLQFLKGR